jgi:predicted amidohydrolase YtcJ
MTTATSAAAQQAADLIITNANIRTLKSRDARARAAAVRDGRIIAVGADAAIGKFAGSNTEVIDAAGRLVLPGFNDAHVHLVGVGNMFSHLNVSTLNTRAAIIESIDRYSQLLPKGRWILGRGWRENSALPPLSDVDAVSPDNPLLIYSHDYTRALVNSAALSPVRLRSSTGVITGAELQAVSRRIPQNFTANLPEVIETAGNYAASLGVTSVQDVHSDDLFDVLNELDSRGLLKFRVYDCIGLGERHKAVKSGHRAAAGTPMVRRGCVKGSADGDDGEVEELTRDIAEADRAGLQVMVHAIGQRSNHNILTVFERVTEMNGRRDRRFRVEHAARMRAFDIDRFKRTNILASMQPYLFYSGTSGADDYRSIFGAASAVAFGSDASMISLDPLLGIYAAANSGAKSIGVYEALRAYTIGSAYAEFQENEKGTIEAGKLADLVILSDDIIRIRPDRIKDARVVMTIVSGKVVYDNR